MNLAVIVLLFAVSVFSQAVTENCLTPNNEQAKCVSLYTCSILINALASQQPAVVDFVRNSTCGGTVSDPMVCCGSLSSLTLLENNPGTINAEGTETLLSDRQYCGYQHSDDYFSTGIEIGIDEFPWLALLMFTDDDGKQQTHVRCGGSLINDRYVLTAAHCVWNPHYRISAVRLGDYNVKTETDCVENRFGEECSETPKEYGIEKKIRHPLYSPRNATNDIALLRLNRRVQYSDFIRPICLPTSGTTFAKIGDTLFTSGWGQLSHLADSADTKKKIKVQLLSNDVCLTEYNNHRKAITENNLCTKHLNTGIGQFACGGDSGGPLLFSHRKQWHQEGILSFGKRCGSSSPDVYTKVANYLDWIKESIEP